MTERQARIVRNYWRIRTRITNFAVEHMPKPEIGKRMDALDKNIADGVESFIVYMDHHPGFAAVLNPMSVMRRITYRHTEEIIDRNRR